jgi:hypothetical protein
LPSSVLACWFLLQLCAISLFVFFPFLLKPAVIVNAMYYFKFVLVLCIVGCLLTTGWGLQLEISQIGWSCSFPKGTVHKTINK